MIRNNKIYNENCLDTMARMDDNVIDLTVTSPPYDGLRAYNGYSFDFESIAKELYRTTKEGGVVVWVVGDATIKGDETGTSFKQALFFKEIGFNLHDTMIWSKPVVMPTQSTRYQQGFEFMFIFTKGKVKTFNPIKIKSKSKGKKVKKLRARKDGWEYNEEGYFIVSDNKMIDNVWSVVNVKNKTKHKAVFPEKLANDHIISWSNEGDLVYDPFMGSGTTAKMAKRNNRNYIGSEISSEYCKIIDERLINATDLFNEA
jgi:site-specific DNA-methyltransferase (adenine-specific)